MATGSGRKTEGGGEMIYILLTLAALRYRHDLAALFSRDDEETWNYGGLTYKAPKRERHLRVVK